MVGNSLARTVRRLVVDEATNVELLRRFIAAGDEAAFALLVRRHGPMVFGVCRRTLRHQQDAEDAFQATFLILARKADTVRPDGLSRWLYGVAVRVASKARTRQARRQLASVDLDQVSTRPEPAPNDWLQLLDAALARMSARDREPIRLCDLLGRSRAEAALELGIAEGTLSSRLARARERLRARLARLGTALSLSALVVGLADQAEALIPAQLIETTIAAGTSAAAARELADGVLRTMFLAKVLKLTALGLCLVGGLTAGLAWLPSAGADPVAGGKENTKGSPPAKEAPKTDSDTERIQGTWIVESAKARPEASAGNNPPRRAWEDTHGMSVMFSGDRVESALFPGSLRLFHLDSAHDPKRMDFTFRELINGGGPRQVARTIDEACPSIYKFDGEKLRIVLGDQDLRERPDSFEWAGPRSPFVHIALRRPTEEERKSLERSEASRLQGTWVGLMKTVAGMELDASKDLLLVVKGDRLRFDVPGTDPLHATFVLDMSPSPWHIDLTATQDGGGLKKGAKVAGIVTRRGDFLSLALGTVGRPVSFEAAGQAGTAYTLVPERTSIRQAKELLRPAGSPPLANPEAPSKLDNSRLRQLQTERVKALQEQLDGQYERVKIGKDPLIQLIEAVRELGEAELDVAESKEARIAAVEKMAKTFRDLEGQLIELRQLGLQTNQGVAQAKAARLKTEVQLEKLKLGR
jgi:RNA polymerase sigma factor (sigma-70 family)